MSSCYTSFIISKTGHCIPCYKNNKPSSSIYNPVKEANNFVEGIKEGFNIIFGYGCGLHIIQLLHKLPTSKILVVEKNEESINFLRNLDDLVIPDTVIFCTPSSLYATLLQVYFAPLDGDLGIHSLRTWVDVNKDEYESGTDIIHSVIQTISKDISTQAHFAKIWHRNILQNLEICSNHSASRLIDIQSSIFPTAKTAFIAGAGPSLENDIAALKENREKYFVIATDTAYAALSLHEIHCDVVVSVDPQHVSMNHFFSSKNDRTLFAFDLCANPVAIKNLSKQKKLISLFKSEHPLCVLADTWYKDISGNQIGFFPTILSEAGTVTLCALNIARFCGFTKYVTSGCDFAYTNGKMYASGTYIDTIYNAQSNKLQDTQSLYTKLMYKSTIIMAQDGKTRTTKLLQDYKKSVDIFFENISSNSNSTGRTSLDFRTYDTLFKYTDFMTYYVRQLEKNEKIALSSILPLVSYYNFNKKQNLLFEEILKIAQKTTVQI